MRRKYLRKNSFFQVKKKQNNSTAWNGILDARDLITKGMRWILGNGKNIMFWTFNWVFDNPLINLIPDGNRSRININETVNDYIINGRWDVQRLASVHPIFH